MRLAGDPDKNGKLRPRSNNTVRLELALLGHLFTVAIKEWGFGLPFNPVSNIRRPAPDSGRNRRLTSEEQTRLLQAVDKHSNPMFGWIVRIAVQTGMRLSEIATLRIAASNVPLVQRPWKMPDTC
ncbi:Site-specific recombinase XerD [Bordetella pseudohinzii]|uniref:Site-specific recombinase XerD n=1 Tax=Bordetella pseudohinzii TaxID=1331258 RepID=A0A0M7F5S9_9BORD|nr:Site-specific recombinase XerD [Bordetella pseudohinzii]